MNFVNTDPRGLAIAGHIADTSMIEAERVIGDAEIGSIAVVVGTDPDSGLPIVEQATGYTAGLHYVGIADNGYGVSVGRIWLRYVGICEAGEAVSVTKYGEAFTPVYDAPAIPGWTFTGQRGRAANNGEYVAEVETNRVGKGFRRSQIVIPGTPITPPSHPVIPGTPINPATPPVLTAGGSGPITLLPGEDQMRFFDLTPAPSLPWTIAHSPAPAGVTITVEHGYYLHVRAATNAASVQAVIKVWPVINGVPYQNAAIDIPCEVKAPVVPVISSNKQSLSVNAGDQEVINFTVSPEPTDPYILATATAPAGVTFTISGTRIIITAAASAPAFTGNLVVWLMINGVPNYLTEIIIPLTVTAAPALPANRITGISPTSHDETLTDTTTEFSFMVDVQYEGTLTLQDFILTWVEDFGSAKLPVKPIITGFYSGKMYITFTGLQGLNKHVNGDLRIRTYAGDQQTLRVRISMQLKPNFEDSASVAGIGYVKYNTKPVYEVYTGNESMSPGQLVYKDGEHWTTSTDAAHYIGKKIGIVASNADASAYDKIIVTNGSVVVYAPVAEQPPVSTDKVVLHSFGATHDYAGMVGRDTDTIDPSKVYLTPAEFDGRYWTWAGMTWRGVTLNIHANTAAAYGVAPTGPTPGDPVAVTTKNYVVTADTANITVSHSTATTATIKFRYNPLTSGPLTIGGIFEKHDGTDASLNDHGKLRIIDGQDAITVQTSAGATPGEYEINLYLYSAAQQEMGQIMNNMKIILTVV